MPFDDELAAYRAQTVCSDPGRMAEWIGEQSGDLAELRRLVSGLLFHYRANGDLTRHGFGGDRFAEIDLRYAEEQFARLAELHAGPLEVQRTPTERILGCCRDFTLLFVSLARRAGIPARSRVGFAGYFDDGWWIDHVVAEVWDADAERWRLVEPQLREGFVDSATGAPLDLIDVPRDRFLTGDEAWLAARAGRIDPERCVVASELELPALRSWPYLAHNLVLDLVSRAGHEALLWETWGVLDDFMHEAPDAAITADLDRIAARLADPATTIDEVRALAEDPRFAVPEAVTNHSPLDGSTRRVTLRTR
ncbi:transglutaminase-like domain-containing protein [Agromyces sp. NPDC056379]|uniref:transglutaminase-like domain-containing protein n=1 Tax=unclassified Agromyces TaxID=2639701 RepID=UPI0035DD69F3